MHNSDVIDKDVFDVNGHRLGHVDVAREVDGYVLFDVRLSGAGRRLLRTEEPVLTFGADDVVTTEDDVTLADDADHLMRLRLPSTPERSG